jgi:hypothetical protein
MPRYIPSPSPSEIVLLGQLLNAADAKCEDSFIAAREKLKCYNHLVSTGNSELPEIVRKVFAEAVFFSTLYHHTGPGEIKGAESVLTKYLPFLPPYKFYDAQCVAQSFGLDESFSVELIQKKTSIVAKLERHRQVIECFTQERSGQELYRLLLSQSEEVETVITDYQIFFLTKHETGRLGGNSFATFPIFGPCKELDQKIANDIATRLSISPLTVQDIVVRSVAIIPKENADTFLCHDTWGHFFQLFLTSFDRDYKLLAQSPDTLDAHTRLQLAFTHIAGELIADLVEYRYYVQMRQELPTTSMFSNETTKLDLSLQDAKYLYTLLMGNLNDARYMVIISNLVKIHNAIADLEKRGYLDTLGVLLLALFIGCWCSCSEAEGFWSLDEIIAEYFIPCLKLL